MTPAQFCRQCRQNLRAIGCPLPLQEFFADPFADPPVQHGQGGIDRYRNGRAGFFDQAAEFMKKRVGKLHWCLCFGHDASSPNSDACRGRLFPDFSASSRGSDGGGGGAAGRFSTLRL